MKKILITGGAGFIGSNLAQYILENETSDDLTITILDALTYAGNEANVPRDSRVSLEVGDVRNANTVNHFVSRADEIYHLAAESHVDRSIENPNLFIETNILGTANILEALRSTDKRGVIVSTDEVYGSLEYESATEEFGIKPSSPYSASKAGADLLALASFQTFKTNVIVTRCTNNFGPNQYPEKLIPVVINRAKNNLSIPVYGDGTNVRDWIHVEDHCSGLFLAMQKGIIGNIYNFGNDQLVSNLEIVYRILGIMGKPLSLIEFVEDRLGHDFRYSINAKKSRKELGWKPRRSLESDLPSTVYSYL